MIDINAYRDRVISRHLEAAKDSEREMHHCASLGLLGMAEYHASRVTRHLQLAAEWSNKF